MNLLFKSSLRHMKRHYLQTILTFIVIILVTAMMSAIFNFISSFQNLIRKYALETQGDYHYCYYAPVDTDSSILLYEMAESWQNDSWFSSVTLKENNDNTELFLTVASPSAFMSKKMYKKLDVFIEKYHATHSSQLILGQRHNMTLLASYGDLNKENGIYSIILIFFLMLAIVSISAVLILVAIFQVSASQREKEFALLISLGADRLQIKILLLFESVLYICFSIPLGYLLGIVFLKLSTEQISNLLYSFTKVSSLEIIVSIPFSAIFILCTICIILSSGYISAAKAAKISPLEILKKTHDIYMPKNEKSTISIFEQNNIERWLALKNQKRFRRLQRPILLILSITFSLCIVLTSFWKYSSEVREMTIRNQCYNICIDLFSDDINDLNKAAEELTISSGYELCSIREAIFALHSPYPLSESGNTIDFFNGQNIMPSILLISINDADFQSICSKNQIGLDEFNSISGIFIDTDRTWKQDGKIYKGKPYEVKKGDVLTIYENYDTSQAENGVDIYIAGVLNKFPQYVDVDIATRMAVLVPEDIFLQLEPLRPYSKSSPGLHHISLRCMTDNASNIEKKCNEYIGKFQNVTATVTNYDDRIQNEQSKNIAFEYLCAVFIFLLIFICVCGNYTISWSINRTRQKEFAILMSIGMASSEIKKMRYWELLFNILYSVFWGTCIGFICHWLIYKTYSMDYWINWHFPWEGLLLGIIVVFFTAMITEFSLKIYKKDLKPADAFREVE